MALAAEGFLGAGEHWLWTGGHCSQQGYWPLEWVMEAAQNDCQNCHLMGFGEQTAGSWMLTAEYWAGAAEYWMWTGDYCVVVDDCLVERQRQEAAAIPSPPVPVQQQGRCRG